MSYIPDKLNNSVGLCKFWSSAQDCWLSSKGGVATIATKAITKKCVVVVARAVVRGGQKAKDGG
jgi:hypothetical protein